MPYSVEVRTTLSPQVLGRLSGRRSKYLQDRHAVKSVLTGRGPKPTVHLQGALGGKYLPSRFRVSIGTLVSRD